MTAPFPASRGQNENRVLHIDFIALRPDTAPEEREALLAAASGLGEMTSVLEVGAIEADAESEYELAVYFLLDDFLSLEPFGTDARYVRFLQGTVAPLLRGFGGANVRLESAWPGIESHAACLAITAPEETYDWEVRDRLLSWLSDAGGSGVVGLAAGERQRYRGIALRFGRDEPNPTIVPAGGAVISGRARRL